MDNSFNKYTKFSATDFALDDDFINWVLLPNGERNIIWNKVISELPEQKENIETAKKILFSFDTSVEKVPEKTRDRIWSSIISKTKERGTVSMKFHTFWWAAASVIIVLLAGFSYFYFNGFGQKTGPVNIAQNSDFKKDIPPGGNKALLTLADGSTIVLDSVQNGMLSQQGNAQVIKLQNGKLAYQKGGIEDVMKVEFNTISTPRGGQYQLELADGSKVWLNAASSITFPTTFLGNDRKVKITGEVYFEIAHNSRMPFHVTANSLEVEVLGTHFNVNAYSDEGEIKTTLLEGSVKVIKEGKSVLINPGEQVLAREGSGVLSVKKGVDVEAVMAWKDGYFQFENLSIKEIMYQVSRWYNVDVIYEGKAPSGHYVGKPSRDLNLSEIIKVIELSGVKITVIGKTIIVKD
ncbi:MAG: FecR domain-containing protein [Ginsengibacter sp.]